MDFRYTPPKDAIIHLTDRSDVTRVYRLRHFKRKYPALVGDEVLQKGLDRWLGAHATRICNKTLHSAQVDISQDWPLYKECAIEFERSIRFGCTAYAGTIEWCTGLINFETLLLKDFNGNAFHKACDILDYFIHQCLPKLRYTQAFTFSLHDQATSS